MCAHGGRGRAPQRSQTRSPDSTAPVHPVESRTPVTAGSLPAAVRHEAPLRQQIQSKEQREGRILRQGNQNPEVQILRYVVEGSFDAYSWQTIERKAKCCRSGQFPVLRGSFQS
jgi:hypothetical protein